MKNSMNIIKVFVFTLLFLLPRAYAVEVKRIPVLRQQRGGSCGYHALRNGILIANSINNPSSKEALNLEDLARVSDDAKSPAYISVIRSRARKLAAHFIKDYLLESMDGTLVSPSTLRSYALNLKNNSILLNKIDDPILLTERSSFYNRLVNVAQNLAKAQFCDTCTEQKYEITSENLLQAFNEEMRRINWTYSESDLNKKINALFPGFKTLRFSILNDTTIRDENNKTIYQANYALGDLRQPSCPVSAAGEWLSSEEINDLLKLERSNPNSFLNKKTQVFILDDAFDEQLERERDLKEFVSNMRKKDFEGIAILVVYYSSHWIACIIHKQKNQQPVYLFADSLNQERLLKDKKTLAIIKAISGGSKSKLGEAEGIGIEINDNSENALNNWIDTVFPPMMNAQKPVQAIGTSAQHEQWGQLLAQQKNEDLSRDELLHIAELEIAELKHEGEKEVENFKQDLLEIEKLERKEEAENLRRDLLEIAKLKQKEEEAEDLKRYLLEIEDFERKEKNQLENKNQIDEQTRLLIKQIQEQELLDEQSILLAKQLEKEWR